MVALVVANGRADSMSAMPSSSSSLVQIPPERDESVGLEGLVTEPPGQRQQLLGLRLRLGQVHDLVDHRELVEHLGAFQGVTEGRRETYGLEHGLSVGDAGEPQQPVPQDEQPGGRPSGPWQGPRVSSAASM